MEIKAEQKKGSILEARGITKYFGAITALYDVNFHVGYGEVLGVVGDNGAGKSTLMKILSGLYEPSGENSFLTKNLFDFPAPKLPMIVELKWFIKILHSLEICRLLKIFTWAANQVNPS